MGFKTRKTLRESLARDEMHTAPWGRFEVDPLAQQLSPQRVCYGLALFDPAATPEQRRRVTFRLMFKGPSRTAYGSMCISLGVILAIVLSPFDFLVRLLLGLLVGVALWRLLSVVSVRISAKAWEEAVLWWPDTATPGRHIPAPLGTVLDALGELDETAGEITAEGYRLRWQQIYHQAVDLKNATQQ